MINLMVCLCRIGTIHKQEAHRYFDIYSYTNTFCEQVLNWKCYCSFQGMDRRYSDISFTCRYFQLSSWLVLAWEPGSLWWWPWSLRLSFCAPGLLQSLHLKTRGIFFPIFYIFQGQRWRKLYESWFRLCHNQCVSFPPIRSQPAPALTNQRLVWPDQSPPKEWPLQTLFQTKCCLFWFTVYTSANVKWINNFSNFLWHLTSQL